MSGIHDALLVISAIIREHFSGIWFLVLVLVVAWAFASRVPAGSEVRRADAPPRNSADLVALSGLICLLALYLFVTFYHADFADRDQSVITGPIIRQHGTPATIWPSSGRFIPLGNQEFDILRHFTTSIRGYLGFAAAELLVFVCALFFLLRDFRIAARALIVGLILIAPSVSLAFAGLVFSERNLLVLLALLALTVQRYDDRPSRMLLGAALALTHVALYYKEPVFTMILGFSGARLALAWHGSGRTGDRSWRRTMGSHPLEVGMVLLAAVFIALYLGTMLPYRSMGYAAQYANRAPPWSALLWYLRSDPILLVFLAVVTIRTTGLIRVATQANRFWDPLALGGLAYFAVYVVLGMRAWYYMAPVDLAAVLYVGERARISVAAGRLRPALPVALALLIAVPVVSMTWYDTMRRKNMVRGNVALAEFVKRIADSAGAPTRVFIPLQTDYGTMEFGMLLWYKGVRVVPDSLANGRARVVVLEGPHEFAGGKCVPFRSVPCTRAARPTPGAMILTFPEDEPPGLNNPSLRPAGPSITVYEPYLFPWAMPWLRPIRKAMGGWDVSPRTDWMWAYAVVSPGGAEPRQ